MKNDKIAGGKADNLCIVDIAKKFDKKITYILKQLIVGIHVEYEHTNDQTIAMEIALDHLSEMPDYYSRLLRMEKQGEKKYGTED